MRMDSIKLFESELKLMELIWEHAPITAKELTLVAEEEIGWNKNTTYTILKKLVQKEVLKREEPNFVCIPLVTRDQIVKTETEHLLKRLFKGSRSAFVSSFFEKESLSREEVELLKKIIEKNEDPK